MVKISGQILIIPEQSCYLANKGRCLNCPIMDTLIRAANYVAVALRCKAYVVEVTRSGFFTCCLEKLKYFKILFGSSENQPEIKTLKIELKLSKVGIGTET